MHDQSTRNVLQQWLQYRTTSQRPLTDRRRRNQTSKHVTVHTLALTCMHTGVSVKGDPVPGDTPPWGEEQLYRVTAGTHHHPIREHTPHPEGEGGEGRGGGRRGGGGE